MASVASTRATVTTEIGKLDAAIAAAVTAVDTAWAAARATDYDPDRADGRKFRPYQEMTTVTGELIKDRFARLAMISPAMMVSVRPKPAFELNVEDEFDKAEARLAGGKGTGG